MARKKKIMMQYINGLVQDCSNSSVLAMELRLSSLSHWYIASYIANALELPQSYTKPPIYVFKIPKFAFSSDDDLPEKK